MYSHGAKPNEYTGGQIFYNPYINSLDYGIQLSSDLGPSMKEVTDRMYEAMLPSPRSSEFLRRFWDKEDPSPEFRKTVIIPFEARYFYPYSAEEFRQQLYRLPNWEYYYMIITIVPDAVLLRASWEIVKAHPFFALRFAARNIWYFLYEPGYFHTRFNPIAIFHGGLFFPLDGQASMGGKIFGAQASILGLPARATQEVAFDTFEAQAGWMKRLYLAVRDAWLASYDEVMHAVFFLFAPAWAAMVINWLAAWARAYRLRRWSAAVAADQLAPHVLYVTVFLLYNALPTAAFAEPDYRYGHMLFLVKITLAGFGAIALTRIGREFLRPLVPKAYPENTALAVDFRRAPLLALSGGMAIAVCTSWAWYMSRARNMRTANACGALPD